MEKLRVNGLLKINSYPMETMSSMFWENFRILSTTHSDLSPGIYFKYWEKMNFSFDSAIQAVELQLHFIKASKNVPMPNNPECMICGEDDKKIVYYHAQCGHVACAVCLRKTFEEKLNRGIFIFNCISKKCMENPAEENPRRHIERCYGKEVIEQVLPERQKIIWHKIMFTHWLSSHKQYSGCTNAQCDRILQSNCPVDLLEDKPTFGVFCFCGWGFCLRCKKLPHMPMTCEKFGAWNQFVSEEEQKYARALEMAGAKQCPSCSATTTRPDDLKQCLLMHCPNCSTKWCWNCMGDFKSKNHPSKYSCRAPTKAHLNTNPNEKQNALITWGATQYVENLKEAELAVESLKLVDININIICNTINDSNYTPEWFNYLEDILRFVVKSRMIIAAAYAFTLTINNAELFNQLLYNLGLLQDFTDEMFHMFKDYNYLKLFNMTSAKLKSRVLDSWKKDDEVLDHLDLSKHSLKGPDGRLRLEKCFIDQNQLDKAFEMIVKGGKGSTAFEKFRQIRETFKNLVQTRLNYLENVFEPWMMSKEFQEMAKKASIGKAMLPTEAKQGWDCNHCGNIDIPLGLSECDNCKVPKPGSAQWECQTCTLYNDKDASECCVCLKPRHY
jgi:hypothetical protein